MKRKSAFAALALMLACGPVFAQQAPDSSKYVSREEYEKLLKQMQDMRSEMDAMKKDRAPAPAPAAQADPSSKPATQADVDQVSEDLEKRIRVLQKQTDMLKSGSTNIFLAGDAAFGFTAMKHEVSTFDAGVAPLILWKLSDRVLVEAGLDIGFSTDDAGHTDTKVDLTIANLSYMVDPALIVGAGLFVVPFGVFHNHYDPPWINKLPDEPLPFGDNAIAPSSEVGAYVEGAFKIWEGGKINYAVYVTNGPQLITDDSGAAGSLNFDDYTDINNNKAVGGRIGFLPTPEMEFGYSIMFADCEPEGFQRTQALLQAVDFAYKKPVAFLDGTVDFRTEWVFSHVERMTYKGTGWGPYNFGNDRNGGYFQLAYRPTLLSNKILRNIEGVVRWDRLDVPKSAPGGGFEERWTIGLDYWIMPNMVLKGAYEFDARQVGGGADALMIQLGVGL